MPTNISGLMLSIRAFTFVNCVAVLVFRSLTAWLDALIAETQKEEDYLLEKSKEFSEKIDERLLASYNRIRTSSINGLAVVGLERGAPKGSFFTIPPQKQMEIAQRKKIIIDEHSGKILVDDELVMEENERMASIIKF